MCVVHIHRTASASALPVQEAAALTFNLKKGVSAHPSVAFAHSPATLCMVTASRCFTTIECCLELQPSHPRGVLAFIKLCFQPAPLPLFRENPFLE